MKKKSKIISDTEKRSYEKFLEYNEKQLTLAKENEDKDKIILYENNIRHYKILLGLE